MDLNLMIWIFDNFLFHYRKSFELWFGVVVVYTVAVAETYLQVTRSKALFFSNTIFVLFYFSILFHHCQIVSPFCCHRFGWQIASTSTEAFSFSIPLGFLFWFPRYRDYVDFWVGISFWLSRSAMVCFDFLRFLLVCRNFGPYNTHHCNIQLN